MNLISSPETAARLARAIVSDIALYNKEKVFDGIRNDNIFEVLEREIREGLELYLSRVDPELHRKINYYNIAIVDILIKRSGGIKSQIW
ncbi:MAG: hypothetical protein AABZ23_05670 [Deltaproteobacteria bacterium]